LNVYEQDLKIHPNRFNGLYGAAVSAEKSGNTEKAFYYYQQLLMVANGVKSNRPELTHAKIFIASHKG
jgi:hypothetical protein